MNDQMSMEEMEAFLIEAELVNQKVKALAENRMSPQEFDRLEALRAQDLKKRQDFKKKKAQQEEQKKRNGRQGKGIAKDFVHFCRACHLEYVYETPKCVKCQRPTMTLQQRQKQLQEMVEDYKNKKTQKEQRKQKWEMWKKTKQMLWKKTSTSYNKWDVYTSSEDEEKPQHEPIVPKDDPNFKALELDMLQRKKRREEETKKANNLKEKGNAAMKEGDYQKAMECYTLALEHIKDMKAIYTNRALAFIKLKKYAKAIKDCDNVIQYIEIFEKGNEFSNDLAFKAYSRKALAHKQRKEYRQALTAIESALKIFPKEEPALKLKIEIQNFIKHTQLTEKLLKKQQKQNEEEAPEQVKESKFSEEDIVKQLAQGIQPQISQPAESTKELQEEFNKNPIESIKRAIREPSESNLELLLNLLLKHPEYKNILISGGGIKKLTEYILNGNPTSTAALIICYTMDSTGVAEKDIWDTDMHRIQKMAKKILMGELKAEEYSKLQDLFEILVGLSLCQKYRLLMSTSQETIDFLMSCYPIVITKYKKQVQLVSAFIILTSNLCMGQSTLKNELEKNLDGVLASLTRIIEEEPKRQKMVDLQKSVYNFISNLLTKDSIRQTFGSKQNFVELLVSKLKNMPKRHEFQEAYVSLLNVFCNLTFTAVDGVLETLKKLKVHEILFENRGEGERLLKGLQVLSKLSYKNIPIQKQWIRIMQKYFTENSIKEGLTNHALRFVNNLFMTVPDAPLPSNLSQIAKLMHLDIETLFCNCCTFFGLLADSEKYRKEAQLELRNYIVRLITVAKQKTGHMRKSSAILLAKIARDETNKDIFMQHHGMDVLKSVAHLILSK